MTEIQSLGVEPVPFVADPDFVLYVGDVRDVLKTLPDESIDCCVTSPPYWGLRDYGHVDQIGLEPTPEAFVCSMVDVFRQVRRALKPEGTLWLNLGDSYTSIGRTGRKESPGVGATQEMARVEREVVWAKREEGDPNAHFNWSLPGGQKPKDLVGIPWRVAFALQADGWFLRSDIIWHKPNPMPESVTDRPTKSHEYLFLLTKSARYFYDVDAIREPAAWDRWGDQTVRAGSNPDGWIKPKGKNELPRSTPGQDRRTAGFNERWDASERTQMKRALALAEEHGLTEAHIEAIRAVGITDTGKAQTTQAGTGRSDPEKQRLADEAKAALGGYYREFLVPLRRNARSVWTIPTRPYAEAHFATFPEALPERCISAGCPAGGVVLDPFMGSGTTALVARKLGRRSVGVELNPEYAGLCATRLSQLSLLAEPAA